MTDCGHFERDLSGFLVSECDVPAVLRGLALAAAGASIRHTKARPLVWNDVPLAANGGQSIAVALDPREPGGWTDGSKLNPDYRTAQRLLKLPLGR